MRRTPWHRRIVTHTMALQLAVIAELADAGAEV